VDNIDEIKKRINIVEFIGQYLQMKKVGINYSALCPFHKEKTPSFMVSPERQSFKCFGCSEHGDVITFFQKMEGLEFPEALRVLGERVGVQVSFQPKEQVDRERSRRDQIFKINLLAAKIFKAILWSKKGEAALKYLLERGLDKQTIEKLKIGYSGDGTDLPKYFSKYKISFDDAASAGHPERFRYRIMFPIFNTLGQVIGFSGRIFESALPKEISPHPKYLNTPETPVFHKSKALYGINFAKDAIRQNKRAVIVEGQMDVAASHFAGIEEVVASSGTALTEDHLQIVGRYTPNVIFAFDEDEAGQKAAHAAVPMALREGLEIKLTIIDKYKDVGELVVVEKNKWSEILKKALPPVEWLSEKAKKSSGEKSFSAQEKKKLAKDAIQFIVSMPDEIEQAHYVSYLAKVLQVPEITIEKAVEKSAKPRQELSTATGEKSLDLEGSFLSFILYQPEFIEVANITGVDGLQDHYNEIYKTAVSCYSQKQNCKACLDGILKELNRELKEKLESFALEWDVKIGENEDSAKAEFLAIASHLMSEKKEKVKDGFAKLIGEAEGRGDLQEVKKLMRQLQENLGKK